MKRKAGFKTMFRYFLQLQEVLLAIMQHASTIVFYDEQLRYTASVGQTYTFELKPDTIRYVRRKAAPLVKLAKKILGQPVD